MKMYATIVNEGNQNLKEIVKTFDNIEDAKRLANEMNQELEANGLDPDAEAIEVARFRVYDERETDIFTIAECYDVETAIEEAKAEWDRLCVSDRKKSKIYVLEWCGDIEAPMDGDIPWEAEKKFEVNYTDPETGATSPIDTIYAPSDYTAEQYVEDCRWNADEEWNEMLQNGTVELVMVD